MKPARHHSATATFAFGASKQRLQASLSRLNREPGMNSETVAFWRKRATGDGVKTELRKTRSTVLSEAKPILAFRWHTVPPLDDCHCKFRSSIPLRTRSAFNSRSMTHECYACLMSNWRSQSVRSSNTARSILLFRKCRNADRSTHDQFRCVIARISRFYDVQLVGRLTGANMMEVWRYQAPH